MILRYLELSPCWKFAVSTHTVLVGYLSKVFSSARYEVNRASGAFPEVETGLPRLPFALDLRWYKKKNSVGDINTGETLGICTPRSIETTQLSIKSALKIVRGVVFQRICRRQHVGRAGRCEWLHLTTKEREISHAPNIGGYVEAHTSAL